VTPAPYPPDTRCAAFSFRMPRVAPEKADFRPALALRSLPGSNGTNVTKPTYREQLLDPRWQRKRLEMLEAASWECSSCGGGKITLHVHHRRYFKGRMAWEYSNEELEVLCKDCHAEKHAHEELLARVLAEGESFGYGVEVVLGIVAGYFDTELVLSPETAKEASAISGPYFVEGQIGSLMGGVSWGRLAEVAAFELSGRQLNPAQEQLIEFLRSFKTVDGEQ
jgi:hypothetical protein